MINNTMSLSSLERKEVFIFDWDGTIFDSMMLKVETFSSILSHLIGMHLPDADLKQTIADIYKKLSGRPRKEIFYEVLDNFKLVRESISYEDFNDRLMRANTERLEKAAIYCDAESTLKLLIDKKKKIFISSSVPQDELNFFTMKKLSSDLRNGIGAILGSREGFSKGTGHFQFIQGNAGYDKASMIFIGDDLADYQLSAAAGVDFILVDREGRFSHAAISRIKDLAEIGDMIRQ